ncbi:unnamed protein product [Brassica rapa subsp. trilocularis]
MSKSGGWMDHRGVFYTFGPEKVAEFLIKTIWISSVMLNRPVYYTILLLYSLLLTTVVALTMLLQ